MIVALGFAVVICGLVLSVLVLQGVCSDRISRLQAEVEGLKNQLSELRTIILVMRRGDAVSTQPTPSPAARPANPVTVRNNPEANLSCAEPDDVTDPQEHISAPSVSSGVKPMLSVPDDTARLNAIDLTEAHRKEFMRRRQWVLEIDRNGRPCNCDGAYSECCICGGTGWIAPDQVDKDEVGI